MYNLRVVAVLTSNDDGSEAAIVTSDQVQLSMTMANPLYNPYGVNFIFDPTTDVEHRQSTLLNHDSDRNDGQIYTHPNTEPFFSGDSHNQERNSIAQQFAGRLVVYFNSGDRYYWDKTQNRWVYGPRGYNWSNDKDSFVTMTGNDGGSLDFAHEVGHYLHLAHTFSGFPGTIAEAAASIKSFVEEAHNPKERGADVFDGDLPTGVTDTPPDPGSQLFKNPCDPNETSTTIPVKFTDGSSREYVISPDRENIMNYWDKTCRGKPAHISPGQAVRVLDALRTGNRNHLIAPTVLYDAVWENGDRGQTRALAWSLNDFSVRLKDELGQGRHCIHMQAYDVGGNQIRYDGVWEPGGTGQDGVNAWTLNDFAAKFDAETSAQRHVLLMQAYNIGGGQIRYDAIFEAGDRRQTRALGWAFNDFATRHREESAKGHRLIHMQACDVGSGQIRYDGVWEPSANQQEFAFAYAQHDFAAKFDQEIAAGFHVTHMQAYDIGGGQIRYDGTWDVGSSGQTRAIGWAFNDFVARWDKEQQLGRRLVMRQAYDIGGGQIRYDGVWEPGTNGQQRSIGFALQPFANKFNEHTSSGGMHMVMMQAYPRVYDLAAPIS